MSAIRMFFNINSNFNNYFMLDTYDKFNSINPINRDDIELTEQEEIDFYHLELIADKNHNRKIINELIDFASTTENTYLLNKLLKLRK